MITPGKQNGKISLNPHVEPHGNYSIEWSYHFPLRPGLRIESQLEVSFPSEKVPGAAKSSLSLANLSMTRLSFADSASEVQNHSTKFLQDTKRLRDALAIIDTTKSQKENLVSSMRATKFFLNRARQYWTPTFFSQIGVFLQSDLKQSVLALKQHFKSLDMEKGYDWNAVAMAKRKVMRSLRAAKRIVLARNEWEKISTIKDSEISLKEITQSDDLDNQKLLLQLRDVSEYALVLVSNSVAELQSVITKSIKICEEHRTLLANDPGAAAESCPGLSVLDDTLARLSLEKKWTASWGKIINDLRHMCKLIPLTDISIDPLAASEYYDRMRELRRLHYQTWDLSFNLQLNEKKTDFMIGGFAALISAIVAFLLALPLARIAFSDGSGGISVGEQGAIVFGFFVIGNAVVYMLKDRLKEWVKVNMRNWLHIRSGRWEGNCVLRLPVKNKSPKDEIEIASIIRESWWSEQYPKSVFRVWEEFRILPSADEAQARIIKQAWRLPLEEILHMDAASHLLKLPTYEGVPREVRVHKRFMFPFKLKVTVKEMRNRKLVVVDESDISGKILTAGGQILSVE